MKYRFLSRTALICIVIAMTLAVGSRSAHSETSATSSSSLSSLPNDAVLATVNDRSITASDLNQELARPDLTAAVQALQEQPAELNRLKQSVLSSMIDRALLIKAAKSSQNYKPDEVKKEVADLIQEQGGQEVLQPILSSYGTSWENFIKDMDERLTIEKFVEKDLLGSITITDSELKATFSANPELYAEPETVSARHILILVKPKASESEHQAALKRINEIHKMVTAPKADFAKIASETSDDTASKVSGGDLGAFQRGMMVADFEKAAFALKVGEISQPVKTEYGYHLIKVEQHRDSAPPSFEKAKDQVRYKLMAKTHDKIVSDKLTQLRSGATIEYKVEELKGS